MDEGVHGLLLLLVEDVVFSEEYVPRRPGVAASAISLSDGRAGLRVLLDCRHGLQADVK